VELTTNHWAEIQKKSAVEKVEEPEPERKERTVTVSELTEGPGHIEAGVKEFEHIDLDEQQTGTVKQRILRLLACLLMCLLAMRRCEGEKEVVFLTDLNA
jgi:hypothetical protein